MNKNLRGIVTAVALALTAAWASAQESQAVSIERFEIKAQSLSSALRDYADQTGEQVVFFSELGKGLHSAEVVGNYTREQALQRLLDKTGLRFERLNQKTIAITDASKKDRAPHASYGASTPSALRLAQSDAGTLQSEDSLLGGQVGTGEGEGKTQGVTADKTANNEQDPLIKEDLEEVVVTGSHIRGEEVIGSKVRVLNRNYIERSGYATVQDVMGTLTQNSTTGPGEVFTGGPNARNFNRGTAVNLRGLGAASTLVLVNGVRQAVSGVYGTFVDVSSIPTAAVERIEVLTDGMSAVYGSDAVGGVVNIILRKNYQGAETQARVGSYGGDATETQFSQLVGTAWASGNAFVGYQFLKRQALARTDRTYSANSDLRPLGGDNFSFYLSHPGNILDPATFQPVFAIPSGQDGRSLSPDDLLTGEVNLKNEALGSDLLPEHASNSVFGDFRQKVGERVDVFASARFTKRETSYDILGLTTILDVPSTNPFFVDPFGGSSSVYVAYSWLDDLGPLKANGETSTYSGLAGLSWEISEGWNLSFTGAYSLEKLQWAGDTLNDNAVQAALADTNPETAFNAFGSGPNTNNPATIASIRTFQRAMADAHVWSTGTLLQGTVYKLPAGDVRLALGADYRDEVLEKNEVTDTSPAPPETQLHRAVSAAFAELSLPLLSRTAEPGADRVLSLSLAGRFERYSDFGDTFNPRIGLSWLPASNLKIRTTWGTSFKAPQLIELDDAVDANTTTLLPVVDPQSPSGSTLALARIGSNPGLKEETADTWTAGFDWTPAVMKGANFSLTYFHIQYRDRILQGGPPGRQYDILLEEEEWAELIDRDPSAAELAALCADVSFGDCATSPPAVVLDLRLQNLAVMKVRGVDLLLQAAFLTRAGELQMSLDGTYTLDFKRAVTELSPSIDIVDTFNNLVAQRLRGSIGLSRGAFNINASLNYTGSYEDKLSIPTRSISSWTTTDLHLAYMFPVAAGLLGGATLGVGAVNLFDRDPPFANADLGFDPANANPYGRLMSVELRKGW